MAKKYYAVKAGHKPGIYESWDECREQVIGYSGATYKSFPTFIEAEQFLGVDTSKDAQTTKLQEVICKSEATAYVDGSYNESTQEFSYGVVMFYNGIEEHFAEKFTNSSIAEMRNVAGEIKGAQRAMQFCVDNGISSVDIYHDYEGISKWCMDEWKANKIGTKAYKAFFDSLKDKVKVNFIKVKGHSGDKYNDLADELAKSVLF